MQKLGDVFVSGTFAGELLSIEAMPKNNRILERECDRKVRKSW